MSNPVRPQRRQPTRLPRPWDSPGKNTGVGCHFLLQCMEVKSASEVAQSCPTLSDPMDCSPPGSFIHGIFQARVLEWGAIAFSDEMSTIFVFINSTAEHFLKNHARTQGDGPLWHTHERWDQNGEMPAGCQWPRARAPSLQRPARLSKPHPGSWGCPTSSDAAEEAGVCPWVLPPRPQQRGAVSTGWPCAGRGAVQSHCSRRFVPLPDRSWCIVFCLGSATSRPCNSRCQ